MFTETDLRELLEFETEGSVLSVYLNTDPSQGSADGYKLRLRSMLKEIGLAEDVVAVQRYFDHEHDWSGRGVAVFSCQSGGFFRAHSFAVPLSDRVRVSNRPHVKPLADLLDAFGGYGVALVDKQGARLFFFHLGELREQEGVMGEAVRHTKRGGGSQAPGWRGGSTGQTQYAEEVVDRNLKEAASFAARFFAENNVRRVLIGGTEENVKPFRSLLPKAWQSLVVGSFPMSMTASHAEVMTRALEIGQQAEQRREAQLVKNIITGAAKGRGGAIGLEATLQAVHDGRILTLLINEGFRAPGYQCQGCGYLTADERPLCPFCGSHFAQISDAAELVVRQVMQSGGEVEVLHENAELTQAGNIGAALRY